MKQFRNTRIRHIRFKKKKLQTAPDKVIYDLDEICEAIKQDFRNISYVAESIKNDREVIQRLVEINPKISDSVMKWASNALKANHEFVKKILSLQSAGGAFEFIDETLKNDPELVALAIKNQSPHGDSAMKWASETLKGNREFVKKILSLQCSGGAFEFINETLKNDPELLELAIKNQSLNCDSAMRWASNELKADREFVKKILSSKWTGGAFEFIDETLKNDPELVELAIKNRFFRGDSAMKWASKTLKGNRELVKKILSLECGGGAFEFIDKSLKEDSELVELAVKNRLPLGDSPMKWTSESLKKNREFVTRILSLQDSGVAFDFIDETLKKDPQIVELAIKNRPFNGVSPMKWASNELKANREFVKRILSLQNAGGALEFIDETLKNDRELVELSIKNRPYNRESLMRWSSNELKADREFVKHILSFKNSGDAFEFIDETLKNDFELVELAIINQSIMGKSPMMWASNELKANKEFVKKIISLPNAKNVFQFVDMKLKDDPELLELFVEISSSNLEWGSKRLKGDREYIKKILSKKDSGDTLQFVSESLKRDPEIVELAIKTYNDSLLITLFSHNNPMKWAASQLKSNKEFVKKMIISSIMKDGFQYVDESLKNDPEIAELIIQHSPESAEFLSKSIQSNQNFALSVFQKGENSFFFKFLDDPLKKDKEFVLKAMRLDFEIFAKIEPSLFSDAEFMLSAIKENELAIKYAHSSLLQNPQFNSEAIKITGLAFTSYAPISPAACANAVYSQAHHLAFFGPNKSDSSASRMVSEAKNDYVVISELSYVKPVAEELELLQQISEKNHRIGRGQLLQATKKQMDPIVPIETQDAFSISDDNLGKCISTYFKNEIALFEYSIFMPKEGVAPKGIILENYGGYGGHNFNSPTHVIRDYNRIFLDNGYMVVDFASQDNWQTINQWDQITSVGRALLNKTLIQFFLFAQALKEKYKTLPLVYYGASFGGFKGALINLLLSNKDQLKNNVIFTELLPVLEGQNPKLFSGYILHDGDYDYIKKVFPSFHSPIANNTLLLQNFDDDRVTSQVTLDFVEKQYKLGICPGVLNILITPQGAKSDIQVPDVHVTLRTLGSSLDAHRKPNPEKYLKEYDKAILTFLSAMHQQEPISPKISSLTRMRHTHHRELLHVDLERRQLYRLYHALLHSESTQENKHDQHNGSTPMQRRISKAISLLASKESDPQKAYKRILLAHSAWMCITLRQKRSETWRYLRDASKNSAAQRNIESGIQEEISTTVTTKNPRQNFTLTEAALAYLRDKENALELIDRCQQYAKIIQPETLKYFQEHEALTCWVDFASLWQLENINPDSMRLNVVEASRVMSIISLYYTTPKEKLAVLESIQTFKPLETISLFGDIKLPLDTLQYIVNKIIEQPDDEKDTLLTLTPQIISKSNAKELTDWLISIDPAERSITVKNYLIFKNNNNEKIMDLLRRNSDLLSEKDLSIQRMKEIVHHLTNTPRPSI